MQADVQRQLADALRARLAIIADEDSRANPDRHIERLKAVSESIDHLRKELPRPIDPQLNHFLERASYNKALELLETQF